MMLEGNASPSPPRFTPGLALPLVLAAAMGAVGCKSTDSGGAQVRQYDWKSLEAGLKPAGSTATPDHKLARHEYPFDSRGNYVSAWAAEGERRLGRSAYASSGSSRGSSSSSRSSSRPKPTYRYHKVRAGDTLYGLSRRYGTTVARIKSANGLKSDLIVNGRTLRIP